LASICLPIDSLFSVLPCRHPMVCVLPFLSPRFFCNTHNTVKVQVRQAKSANKSAKFFKRHITVTLLTQNKQKRG
jgi:hypothetical protein